MTHSHAVRIGRARRRKRTFTGTLRSLQSTRLGVVLLGWLVMACSDANTAVLPSHIATRGRLMASLTPEVAARLDRDGRFDLSNASTGSQFPEITQSQANLLAATWLQMFGQRVRTYLEKQHGAVVPFKQLRQCGRTLYARSAFAAIPSELPVPYRKPYGPWYLATFCDATGSPSVSVAVSAWNTDLQIVGDRIEFPAQSGNEFFPMGIPAGTIGEFPTTPENAVVLAAQTGQAISGVPELVMPVNTVGPPQGARWSVQLNQPVRVRGSHQGDVSVSKVYVGPARATKAGMSLFVPEITQPSTVIVPWTPLGQRGETGEAFKQRVSQIVNGAVVPRRIDTPLLFDIAVPAVGSQP